MHQREQEKCARERRKAESLIDIADEINATRRLVDAGWLAARGLSDDAAGAMAELMDVIGKRLRAIVDDIEAHQAKTPDAA